MSNQPSRHKFGGMHGIMRHAAFALFTAILTWRLALFCHFDTDLEQEAKVTQRTLDMYAWKTSSSSRKEETSSHASTSVSARKPEAPYDGPSREWEIIPGGFPCVRGANRLMITRPAHEGFLFQRPMKVGSTTMVSVVLRLAHNRSPWLKKENITCRHRSMHGSALELEYDKRRRSKSFLFSLIRHPTKRAVSQFFHFGVASRQIEPTDEIFQAYLQGSEFQHRYLDDLSARNYTQHLDKTQLGHSFLRHELFKTKGLSKILRDGTRAEKLSVRSLKKEHDRFGLNPNMTKIVQDILEDYDFIAITERMDESLVVMQMLLNLTTQDILYTRARSGGAWSNGDPRTKRPCIYITPSFVTPGMKSYFESDEWQYKIRGDLLLYRAASASLDRTIDRLGRAEFDRNLQALKEGLLMAKDNCQGRVRTQCTEGGAWIPFDNNTCYIWGEACDYECINELDLTHLEIRRRLAASPDNLDLAKAGSLTS
mmetsp:Transcript_30612/g.71764  ORF Transcript_30612/g.71764 Transcript_30612/m.71764 type:complete len:483 (-) Transcript_30612:2380-3828(-)